MKYMYVVNQYWYLKKCYIIITFKTCPQGTIPEYVSLGHTRKALKCYVAKCGSQRTTLWLSCHLGANTLVLSLLKPCVI